MKSKLLTPEECLVNGFRGERVPTWEEALYLVQGKVGLNVHLKEGGHPDGRYETQSCKGVARFSDGGRFHYDMQR